MGRIANERPVAGIEVAMKPGMRSDLIFDVGLHKGEDSEFYLRKGFRVVAVDANREMCEHSAERLGDYVRSGQLVILNRAISDKPGTIDFYKLANTEWSTADPIWVRRNIRLGSTQIEKVEVDAVRLVDLFDEFGVPYYLKIDIEGLDVVALQSLSGSAHLPKYVSIESDKVSFNGLRHEFDLLTKLNYTGFKVVPQANEAGSSSTCQARTIRFAAVRDGLERPVRRGSAGRVALGR